MTPTPSSGKGWASAVRHLWGARGSVRGRRRSLALDTAPNLQPGRPFRLYSIADPHTGEFIMKRSIVLAALAILVSGCDGYDPPDEANPFDSIAPAPKDSTQVPGAGEPGSQPVP